MIRRNWIARLFAAAAVAAAVSGSTAQAGLLPVSVTVTPEAGNFRWTYAIVLPTDMKLQSGNYFTIYDFGGLVPDSIAAPDGWSVTVKTATPPPLNLQPNDNPLIDDLTFTYNGPTIPTGQVGLNNFMATSTSGDSVVTAFTAQNPQVSTGNLDRNIVDTLAPSSVIV